MHELRFSRNAIFVALTNYDGQTASTLQQFRHQGRGRKGIGEGEKHRGLPVEQNPFCCHHRLQWTRVRCHNCRLVEPFLFLCGI